MMEGWRAWFIVLLVDLAFGRDIPVNTKFVIKEIDSCPDEGYYFRRDLSPNAVNPGPCYLCFCQNNGTAVCWERDQRRCNVENFHHHRVGRQSRSRRSPASLSDIFFRDTTRDLFNKNSPEECKPFEASYSDGCPPVFNKRLADKCEPFVSSFSDGCLPADWCIGCTVCDCDANGRWDCHILSFCDGKEKKKKVKPGRRSKTGKDPNMSKNVGKKNVGKKSPSKPKPRTITTKTKKVNKKTTAAVQGKARIKTPKPRNNSKQIGKKQKPDAKQQPKMPIRKLMQTKKPQPKKSKQNQAKVNVSKNKIVRRSYKPKSNATKGKPKYNPKSKIAKKFADQLALQRTDLEKLINPSNNNETIKLGHKIVKQVMTKVQKLLKSEIDKINSTRVQRSALFNGRDCGRVKNMEKSSYNVKSKAAAKNKNKYKRHSNLMLKHIKGESRRKRETLNETQAETNDFSPLILYPDNHSVIPLETKKNIVISNVFSDITSTSQNENYYKYSMHNISNKTMNTSSTTESIIRTIRNNSNIFNNIMIPIAPISNVTNDVAKNINDIHRIVKTIPNGDPEANDLKFSKWFIIKTDKKNIARILTPKSKIQLADYTNKTYTNMKPKNNNSKTGVTMRQNPKKSVTEYFNIPKSYSKGPPVQYNTDVTGLENVLSNLIKDLNDKSLNQVRPKPKIGVMKYVRKFFRKLFSKKKTKKYKVYGMGSKEDHALQILCENIGRCKVNRHNKFILKYKLKQLNEHTTTILKSIKIIKGLLHLLDLPYNNTLSNRSEPVSFQNDLRKLSIILKDSYTQEGIDSPLTATQITQINYIKMNTQTFIESVTKFAEILNEIIVITQMNVEIGRSKAPVMKTFNETVLFSKIKKILKKYNVVQNIFIKKIYDMINGFEKKSTKSCTTTTERHVSNVKAIKSDKIIDTYLKNIIENLNRLKNLAQALSPKRVKRELHVRDNALEYLLTLMEYLIKQNHPLDAAPANDGIDFLIDAIKNAPDIKPIKKKVLNYGSGLQINETDLSDLIDEKNADSNRISKEKIKTISEEENITKDDNNELADDATEDINKATQKIYNRKFSDDHTLNEDPTQTTSDYNSFTKKRSNEEQSKTGFEKFESNVGNLNRNEMYAVETEDEVIEDSPIIVDMANTTELIMKTEEHTTPNTNTAEISVTTSKLEIQASSNESSSESQDFTSDMKISKLDWIEATFDKEIRHFSALNESVPNYFIHSPKPTLTTPVPTKGTVKFTENISGLSAETNNFRTGSRKKSLKKTNGDSVMDIKQTVFLNSLDYGTEKSEFEEIESSNEDNSEDESAVYFV